MAVKDDNLSHDLVTALGLALRDSRHKLIQAWLAVPVGIFAILAICFGVDKLFGLGSLPFPASVACLVVLFACLLLSEQVLGEHKTRRAVNLIDISGGWSLRWISLFSTPPFVLLPLSPPIGLVEVLKIIAVFLFGFALMMVVTAYMTRGLHLLLGSSKRTMTERAEELGPEPDEIPMTAVTPRTDGSPTPIATSTAPSMIDLAVLEPPPRVQESTSGRDWVATPQAAGAADNQTSTELPPQSPPPSPRSKIWAAAIMLRLDLVTYIAIFILIGIPVYFAVGYAMPLQLSFSVLTYFAASSLPARWKPYLHPVLVSSLLTVLGLWAIGLTKGMPLASTLAEYRTGAKYLQLWSGASEDEAPKLPGPGDIFGSVLDASIVALALPMYRYRRELKQHFTAIVVPTILVSAGSLFAYPPLCFAIGISPERSLAFAARSLTLALAIPATVNLGGDTNTVAALAIMSGIIGVLIGRKMLAWMRIPEDDYVTRGVTLGANSSAIATAMLLPIDPRAAALSSLSMGLFGTVTVLFTSIPPISIAVRSLVGL